MADDRKFHELVLAGFSFGVGSMFAGWILRRIAGQSEPGYPHSSDDSDAEELFLTEAQQQEAIDMALAEEGYE